MNDRHVMRICIAHILRDLVEGQRPQMLGPRRRCRRIARLWRIYRSLGGTRTTFMDGTDMLHWV